MPQLAINIPPGINNRDTTFAATGAWVDGSGVRFFNGMPETVGGDGSTMFTLSTTTNAYFLDFFPIKRGGVTYLAYGQANPLGTGTAALFVGDASGTSISSPTARTPASLGTNADLGWCFQAWGEILLAAGRGTAGTQGGRLYEQSASSTATHVTQAPARNTCILVTNERQVLSFGCNEEISGTFNPLCIRGSDIEDYTDWTTTATNNAFEHILDGEGEIVAAKKVGTYIAVWTTTQLYLGEFLGDPAQTYRFTKVADNCGPYSVRACTVYNGVAYWFDTAQRLRAWAPNQNVGIIPNPSNVNLPVTPVTTPFVGASLNFLVPDLNFGELSWNYAAGQGAPNRISVYCINESVNAGRPVWYTNDGITDRTAHIHSGLMKVAGFAVTSAGAFFATDVEGLCVSGSYITTGDFYLDESQRRVMLRSFRPDRRPLNSTVAMNVTVSVRDYPTATATTSTLGITTSATKKDFRSSGKIANFRFAPASTDGLRLGRPVFDMVVLGER